MKKDFGVKPYLFPMPVLMIATYGDDGKVDVMNMAWGGICAADKVSLNIDEDHKTSENIKKRGAFTIAVADVKHLKEADFFGIASANTMSDKFERSGLTAVRSEKVDAPVIEEFPVTLECRLYEVKNESYGFHVVGEIVGTLVDESVLDADGRVDVSKLGAFAYDEFTSSYWEITTKAGKAFSDGKALMDTAARK